MRIVHVIDSLSPSGGAEQRLVEEVVALRSRFDQVVVRLFGNGTTGGLDERLAKVDIPVVALGFSSARAGRIWPLIAWRLRREFRHIAPDCVHTSLFTGNLVGQLAAASLGLPVVSTFNRTGELNLQRDLQAGVASWKGRTMQGIGRWSAQRGDAHYRAVGRYALETNCELLGLPFDKSTVVPRGVLLSSEDRRTDRRGFGLPEDVPLFVNAARRVPEKAQHLLVEAFGSVRSELPEAQLAIAGAPGPADAAVREAVSRLDPRSRDAVHLLGHRPDARSLVCSANVFAFSSLSEGSPGAVVEALLLGAPVAAFAIGPVAELTDGGRHAWLAEPGSSEDLAQVMLAAYRDGSRERVGEAQRWAEQHFSLDFVVARLGDLLESRVQRSDRRVPA
jgi:glycosyltransferase involved in cell wall biosynthesis